MVTIPITPRKTGARPSPLELRVSGIRVVLGSGKTGGALSGPHVAASEADLRVLFRDNATGARQVGCTE